MRPLAWAGPHPSSRGEAAWRRQQGYTGPPAALALWPDLLSGGPPPGVDTVEPGRVGHGVWTTGRAAAQPGRGPRKGSGSMSRRLNVEDLMALYGKPRGTIYNWIRKGALPPPIKMGRSLYWLPEEIEHTERQNRKAPAYQE